MELSADQSEAAIPKAHSTIDTYRRYLNRHILPRWQTIRASDIQPIEVQIWLRDLRKQKGLSNGTLIKVRNIMLVVFKHGQRYGSLSRSQESNADGIRAAVVCQRLRSSSADYPSVHEHCFQTQ